MHDYFANAEKCNERLAIALNGKRAALQTKGEPTTTSGASTSAGSDKPTFTREFTANGARIIETDGNLSGPEDEKDFWEGDNMEVRAVCLVDSRSVTDVGNGYGAHTWFHGPGARGQCTGR